MTIRVTPIGGEPVELAEETPCVPTSPPFGKFIGFEFGIVELECYDGTAYAREPTALSVILDNGWRDAFVRIGDAWPLCTVETWRERAERLERELAAVRPKSVEEQGWAFAGYAVDLYGDFYLTHDGRTCDVAKAHHYADRAEAQKDADFQREQDDDDDPREYTVVRVLRKGEEWDTAPMPPAAASSP